jgi:hypothetical protein
VPAERVHLHRPARRQRVPQLCLCAYGGKCCGGSVGCVSCDGWNSAYRAVLGQRQYLPGPPSTVARRRCPRSRRTRSPLRRTRRQKTAVSSRGVGCQKTEDSSQQSAGWGVKTTSDCGGFVGEMFASYLCRSCDCLCSRPVVRSTPTGWPPTSRPIAWCAQYDISQRHSRRVQRTGSPHKDLP